MDKWECRICGGDSYTTTPYGYSCCGCTSRFEDPEKFSNIIIVDIKYIDDTVPRIKRIDVGDWIDLSTFEDTNLKEGDFKLISLGVSMRLPIGYEAHVVPRSSTFKKHFVIQSNSFGVIDNSYCGNDDIWKMPVVATKDTIIEKGTRICQFKIVRKQPSLIYFREVTNLQSENRGGFGSTGK